MEQENFLLIGLGGTGGAVVRELKKKLYVESRSRSKEKNTGEYGEVCIFKSHNANGESVESRIATLSIDSNAKDLNGEGEKRKWQEFGVTLKLEDKEKVLISPGGIQNILGSIDRYPAIEPWVKGDMDFVQEITKGSTEPEGCNQIRRMGRLALSNGNNIENVINAVADRLSKLSEDGQMGADIHIACTLAGGTGSGGVLDVVAQIQKYLKHQSGKFKLYIHCFVTSNDVGSANSGNFYANQYAALCELNAFRVAVYKPWDITANKKERRLLVPEFGESTGDLNGTYGVIALISDVTEGGVNVPLENQIENIAEMLFQLSVRQAGNVPDKIRKALSGEDRTSSYPTDTAGGNRSTAFISYGVQRLAIPDREIREKLVYSFGRQFLLKAVYNNWDEHFRDTPRSFSSNGFVDQRRDTWQLTREHLYLDRVEEEVGGTAFPTYETSWRGEMNKQADRVKERGDSFSERTQWLSIFDKAASEFWERGFRNQGNGGGVTDYFNVRKDPVEIRTRAKIMCSKLEQDLLEGVEKLDQEYALHHLPDAIAFLVDRIEDDRIDFGKLAGEADDKMKKANVDRDDARKQYGKVGRFTFGNKHVQVFDDYRDATTRYYYNRTINLAAEYGEAFCRALFDELKTLEQQIVKFSTRLKSIASSFEIEMESRITEAHDSSKQDDVNYLVDAAFVNTTIRKSFERDKSVQDRHVYATVTALKQLRGDRLEFAAYNENMPMDDDKGIVGGPFVDELQKVCDEHAFNEHEKIREDDPSFNGLFNQNIVHKLYNDYGGEVQGDLENLLRRLISRAMPMISFDRNEEPMDVVSDGPVLSRLIFVPKCSSVPSEFRSKLKAKIESIKGNQGACKVVETQYREVPEDQHPGEIAIITIAQFFPARYTQVVHGLHDHYLKRLEHEPDRAYFLLHTETHRQKLPDLMKLARDQVLKQHFPIVLLATAMEIMQIPEDGEEVLFGTVDEYDRVIDKIETRMKMNSKIRSIEQESEERFGQPVSIELITLYQLYLKEFSEEKINDVYTFIKQKLTQGEADIKQIEHKLNTMSGEAFILSGKKESDEAYQMFYEATDQAIQLSRSLSDRSSL